jgi:hypothetical protein
MLTAVCPHAQFLKGSTSSGWSSWESRQKTWILLKLRLFGPAWQAGTRSDKPTSTVEPSSPRRRSPARGSTSRIISGGAAPGDSVRLNGCSLPCRQVFPAIAAGPSRAYLAPQRRHRMPPPLPQCPGPLPARAAPIRRLRRPGCSSSARRYAASASAGLPLAMCRSPSSSWAGSVGARRDRMLGRGKSSSAAACICSSASSSLPGRAQATRRRPAAGPEPGA